MLRISEFVSGLILVFILTGAGATFAGEDTPNTPVLSIEEKVFYAGTVVEGVKISHTFTIKNSGMAPLKITRVKPACSCTDVKFDELIPPGKKGSLRATFRTEDEAGEQIKGVKIYSNDPATPVVKVEIAALVLEALTVKPDRIFLNGLTGVALEKTIRISAPENRVFDLKLEENMLTGQVTFSIEKSKFDNSYNIIFKNRAAAPETCRGRVILKTDIKERPFVTIPVYSRIREKQQNVFGKAQCKP
ncbi:MAG: DUF1573 domain-containing protein [Desulfobacteraceae bacterium]|nr:DUF1573 domain-containing protein [Desulfobacteraceae bacterium]